MATTSSGLTPLCGSFPKKFFTICTTFGMRVMPPTRIDLVDLAGLERCVAQRCLARPDRLLKQVVDQSSRAWRG